MTADTPVLFDTFTLSRNWRIALFTLGAISLLAMLAYPFGYDQAAFMIGGEMVVKKGAIPYRDFFDTKPPVVFYLYGIASFLFGHNTWGIRLFDIVWQIATILFLYRLLRRYISEPLAYLSAFLYVTQYALTGYWMTAQTESFAILPTLLVISLTLDREKHLIRNAVLCGVLLGVIFLLKFTIITFFIGVTIYLLFGEKRKQAFFYCFITAASFAAVTLLYIAYLHYTGALDHFLEGVQWVRQYGALVPFFDQRTISGEFKQYFPENLLRWYSISLTMLGLLGLGWAFTTSQLQPRSKQLLKVFAFALVCSLLGVVYERKFFPYHYTRAFVFFSVFVSIGLSIGIAIFRERKSKLGYLVWLLPIALFYSPAPHYLSQTFFWPYQWVTGKNREAIVQHKIQDYFAGDQRQTGEYLQTVIGENDNIFVWANGIGVYYFADRLPTTFALTNTPFITPWTSPKWKRELIDQLTKSDPKYIVVEWGDNREYISGTTLDSYQSVVHWPELREIVFNRYREERRFGHFLVYRRID